MYEPEGGLAHLGDFFGNFLAEVGWEGVLCVDWHIWAVRERAGPDLSCVCILSCWLLHPNILISEIDF